MLKDTAVWAWNSPLNCADEINKDRRSIRLLLVHEILETALSQKMDFQIVWTRAWQYILDQFIGIRWSMYIYLYFLLSILWTGILPIWNKIFRIQLTATQEEILLVFSVFLHHFFNDIRINPNPEKYKYWKKYRALYFSRKGT